MIGSLCRARRDAHIGGVAGPPAAKNEEGLTRSSFLRGVAAGLLITGVVAGAGRAFAATPGRVAPVTDLDSFYDAWQDRFNAWDIEAMVDLYLPDVTYINPDGRELIGHAGVRADFEGLFALKPKVDLHDRRHIVYRDTALTTNHWNLKLTDPGGTVQELTGGGIEVICRQADGGWRFIIDDASRSAR
jgi:uncharacterized protein (TIGR02246 family)